MAISRSFSVRVKSCLHSHALSVFSICLFSFVFCACGKMASAAAPAYVQQCNQYAAGGGSGASPSCTLNGVGAGHALLIGIWTTDSALSSVTASSGTPTSVISAFNDNGYGYTYAYILANTASGNITVTANETGYYAPAYISVSEFSNVAASPVDVTGTGQTNTWSAAEISTGSFTTTVASDMMWSLCYGLSGETFSVGTAPVTWSQISNTSPNGVMFTEYGATTTAGSYTGQCYKSSTGYDTSIITVAFKPGGQAATPTFSPAAGTYASSQAVTISDSTSGSTIYYTTNGTTPTTASTTYSSAITVSAVETLKAVAIASGYTLSSVGSAAYVINGPAATPGFSPAAGAYGPAQSVTISDGTTGATIYFTTNGTTPTTSSSTYSSAITVSATETLKAIATAPLYQASAVGSAAYTINGAVATPTFSPAAGAYGPAQSVTISDTTSGSTIYYTTNGTTPTTASATYSSAITVSATETLKAIATKANYSNSAVGSAAYTINGPAATPAFSPAAGTYSTAQTVTITDSTSGATIYYTTNGTTPTTASSTYSSAITVSATETLEAIAAKAGYSNSAVGSAAYTITGTVATPTFSPAAGAYGPAQSVTISDTTSGATIYYTTNGTTPTTASTTYSSAITVSATETLEAIAAETGYTTSAVASAAYTINGAVATPTFSPAAGTYSSTQTVTITDSTSGSTIYYTTNGTTPTTASTTYSSAITVSATETLEAIAAKSGYSNSAVASAVYTIGSSSGPPAYVQSCNSYTAGSGNSQTASCSLSGVTAGDSLVIGIFTTNATLSSVTSSTTAQPASAISNYAGNNGYESVYLLPNAASGSITISATETGYYAPIWISVTEYTNVATSPLDASASASTGNSNYGASDVNTGNFNTTTTYDMLWTMCVGLSGETFTAGTAPVTWTQRISTNNYAADFEEDGLAATPGTFYGQCYKSSSGYDQDILTVALKSLGGVSLAATPTFSPGSGTYTSIQNVTISDATSGATIYYTTNGTTPTTASSVYSSAINISSPTETLEAIATASSYAQSNVGSATYVINLPQVATPTFSPAAGTYSSTQTVTLSDTTSGSSIYYTTNGTTPSTSSTHYTSAISVSVPETLEAIATASGYTNSAVASAAYSINQTATPVFTPVAGQYGSAQNITISDATSGATIYYTTNGTTPTTNSSAYSSAIAVSATETLEALATSSGHNPSAVASAAYTIVSCDGMTVGSSVNGTADLNGFLPFQSATNGFVSQWNLNIANAAVDPNNAAIQTTAGFAGESTHVNFGSSPNDGGIPFIIVDSSSTPKVPITVYDYASNSDNVVAPYPSNVPIEGNAADCSGWPDTYQSDSHTNVLDRYTCWDYETYNTNRCNGLYDASEETIWDMQNGEYRPWGWTSTDAAGLSVMAGLLKYDEAASGTIKHAIRFTMQQSKNDANEGYFVEPASHAAGTTYGAPTVEGMRVRLKSSFNISGYSAINQAILTALQQYGMIMADNGGYFYIQGATDSRWNDSDLSALAGIPSSDFDVIQMTPSYPGYDSATAPTGAAPTISSFTATTTSITSGSSVTFNYSVSGDSYDYIDMIGPVRLTSGSGSVTINPTATQTYTLYSVNQYGNNGSGAGYGVTVSTPITVVVSGSTVVPPTFTPVAGTYSAAQVVTLNTTTYPYATIYYTTDGSTPTTNSTKYPQVPQPMSAQSVGNVESITVSATSTIKAIAVAPGYSSPSAVSSASYTIN